MVCFLSCFSSGRRTLLPASQVGAASAVSGRCCWGQCGLGCPLPVALLSPEAAAMTVLSWGGTGAWRGVCPGAVPSSPWPLCHSAPSTESPLRGRGVAPPVKQKSCKHLLFPQLLSICCAQSRKGEFIFFFLGLLQCLEGNVSEEHRSHWQKVLPHQPPTSCNL